MINDTNFPPIYELRTSNTNPYRIKSIITNYENSKLSKITTNFGSVIDAWIHYEALKASKNYCKLANGL